MDDNKQASERVEAIKQRRAKATPPPWEAEGNGVFKATSCIAIAHQGRMFEEQLANAKFIAAAPDDIDYLLTTLEQQEAEIERLENVESDLESQRDKAISCETWQEQPCGGCQHCLRTAAATAMKSAILEKVREMADDAEDKLGMVPGNIAFENGRLKAAQAIIVEIEKTQIS